jgi:hypothetical protein
MTDIARPTRGLKNRNPGNLRNNPSFVWSGQVGIDSKGFVVFDNDADGIRAMVIDLHTDFVRDQQTSLTTLIREYAPPGDGNNTRAYIAFVAKETGLDPVAPITSFDRPLAAALARAIIRMEQGIQPYDDATIRAGVDAAFLHFSPSAI